MSYAEQLHKPEWKEKRREILQRDFCCCQQCGNEKVIINTTRIDHVDIDEHTDTYRIYYVNPERSNVANIFLPKLFVILNNL